MPAFLLEIGLEEIPASMVPAAQVELEKRLRELVARERLATDSLEVKSFSTPRRLAVLAEGLLPKQADMEEQVVGPSVAVAFKNGVPTPAAIAFAKKSGVDVGELRTVQNAKGEYVTATVRRAGRSAAEVLTGLLPAEIAGISWPKNMYWRAGKPERFVRPVRWLLALLDEEILPLEFAGVTADGVSYGHRVLHGDAQVMIRRPREYAEKLAASYVEVDPEARRQRIRKALDAETRKIAGAHWREDEALVEVVTHLTEWPSVILGSFEASYLELPDEVLVTVMRDHQKYFALEDANGKLLPNFLAVLNIEVDAAGAAIIRHGNERVLRARFNDARFFWDVDQKIPLVDRVEMLKSVTFQKELGSYWDKTERNQEVAERLWERVMHQHLSSLSTSLLDTSFNSNIIRAALLAKTDLTTEMVKEFPELQGIIGGLYGRAQGEDGHVAKAIYDHYKPVSIGDSIPNTRDGCIVALADKISTIIDMFSIGLQPTGSKDPFALRRAGNGIVRILAENDDIGTTLHLFDLEWAGIRGTPVENDPRGVLRASVHEFLLDRFEFYLRESRDLQAQVARAIRKSGSASTEYKIGTGESPEWIVIGYQRIVTFGEVLNSKTGSVEVLAVAELLKRISNILRQAKDKGFDYPQNPYEDHLMEVAELSLLNCINKLNNEIPQMYAKGRYAEIIDAIAELKEPLNQFFDSVMVMVDDQKIRDNRLALLARTESVVRWAADFSELASL